MRVLEQLAPKKQKTSELILDAAERLIGQYGVEAVSIRQIRLAAGSANTVAVQYYFRSKANLVRAIFERRLPAFERQRAAGLRAAQAAGTDKDLHTLVSILLRPIGEATDVDDRRTFAAFTQGLRHISDAMELRYEVEDLAPLTAFVVQLIYDAMPHVPRALHRPRLAEASAAFMSIVVQWDRQRAAGASVLPEPAIMAEAINVALGVLSAPCAPETLAAIAAAEPADAAQA
jgi:AcrR family transcriptional regulator